MRPDGRSRSGHFRRECRPQGLTSPAHCETAYRASNALLLATALTPILGYDKVAKITAKALSDSTTPRDSAVALGLLEC
ncbi:hypothetical protein ACFQZO_08155 [Bradyrhizobium sp. GCM10027634]|uniref:hypothetical protein n=1 Tax=unclassified Bradyrhizobium TaxID=2631580 RepID=UPI001FEDE9B4|nr:MULTISPECIES: hypothetical protein [unclassified Bradyrhizobium]MDN5000851.1 hypothetical protein [Bradyrhizobium sp. WYCCWR 12677]